MRPSQETFLILGILAAESVTPALLKEKKNLRHALESAKSA
jgi:hypothetical protein